MGFTQLPREEVKAAASVRVTAELPERICEQEIERVTTRYNA